MQIERDARQIASLGRALGEGRRRLANEVGQVTQRLGITRYLAAEAREPGRIENGAAGVRFNPLGGAWGSAPIQLTLP